MLKKISAFFSNLFEKDFIIKIASLIAAVVIWFTVSISEYPTTNRTVHNIPVEITLTGALADVNNKLEVISQHKETVSATIAGNRGQIGNISAVDLVAAAYTDNVRSPGTHNLQLRLESRSGKQFDVVEFADPYVLVEFDEIIVMDFEVSPLVIMDSFKVAPGVIADPDDIVISPSTVSVRGPRGALERVKDARIRISLGQELSQTYDYISEDLILYGQNNVPITETENFTFLSTQFIVHIPVLQIQTLELSVQVTNAPDSFNTAAFEDRLVFSVYSLEVFAPSEQIRDIRQINIGEIDMRTAGIGEVFSFNTNDFLPDGYRTSDGTNTVTVTCPSEGLARIELFIPGRTIRFVNDQPQYEYNIITSGFTLFFMGPAEIIEHLSESDISAVIDINNNPIVVSEGDYRLNVDFSIPAYNSVWYSSSDGTLTPKATVTVTLRE